MKKLKSLANMLRLSDQFLIVFSILIGNFLIYKSLSLMVFGLIAFIVCLSSLTFVINDLADAKLDMTVSRTRNPISRKELTKSEATNAAILFLALTFFSLFLLTEKLLPFGLVLIFISITYSTIIRAKALPFFDMLYHGISPALIFIMVNSLFRTLDEIALFVASTIFSIFAILELLQELRDFDTDKKFLRTTAITLGRLNTVKLCITLLSIVIVALFVVVWFNVLPMESLFYIPLSYFLFEPLLGALKQTVPSKYLLEIFRKRMLITLLIFSVLFFVLNP